MPICTPIGTPTRLPKCCFQMPPLYKKSLPVRPYARPYVRPYVRNLAWEMNVIIKWSISDAFYCPPGVVVYNVARRKETALWDKTRSFWDIKNSLSHERGSERSEWASERVSAAEGASEASSPEQANEWAVRANEQTDERVAQYLLLFSCLFHTTVRQMVHDGEGEVQQGEEQQIPPNQLEQAPAPSKQQPPKSREVTRLHFRVVTHRHGFITNGFGNVGSSSTSILGSLCEVNFFQTNTNPRSNGFTKWLEILHGYTSLSYFRVVFCDFWFLAPMRRYGGGWEAELGGNKWEKFFFEFWKIFNGISWIEAKIAGKNRFHFLVVPQNSLLGVLKLTNLVLKDSLT